MAVREDLKEVGVGDGQRRWKEETLRTKVPHLGDLPAVPALLPLGQPCLACLKKVSCMCWRKNCSWFLSFEVISVTTSDMGVIL